MSQLATWSNTDSRIGSRYTTAILFEPLPPNCRYDLILSNPPYVNSESMANLPEEYRREPALAVAGGINAAWMS